MTLNEKLRDIETQFGYWVKDYQDKRLNLSTARQTLEAACKCIILKSKSDGQSIILGKQNIPSSHSANTGALRLEELIDAIDQLKICNDRTVRSQLTVMRHLGNDGSHDPNYQSQKVEFSDIESCFSNLNSILSWFYKEHLRQSVPTFLQDALNRTIQLENDFRQDENWQELLKACNNFDSRLNEFIFFAPEYIDVPINQLPILLNKIRWKLILDFNPQTEQGGLLSAQKTYKSIAQQIYEITIDQKRLTFLDSWRNRYWFFANSRRKEDKPTSLRDWRNVYGVYLTTTLYPAFQELTEKQKIVICFLQDIEKVSEIIRGWDGVERSIKYVICTEQSEAFSYLKNEFGDDLILVDMSVNQFIKQVDRYFPDIEAAEVEHIEIPTRTKTEEIAFLSVPTIDYEKYLSTGVEIIHKMAGSKPVNELDETEEYFFRGATVTERNLFLNHTILREDFSRLKGEIKKLLKNNGTHSEDFTYYPGTGGTTIARQLAFELKEEFPTVLLHKYVRETTVNDILRIIDYNDSLIPLIVFFENHEISESDSKTLIEAISRQKKKALFIRIKRIYSKNEQSKKLSLSNILTVKERSLFLNKYSSLKPERKNALKQIENEYSNDPQLITPFIYGLTAYEKDFLKLEDYLSNTIDSLSQKQTEFLNYVCLIYYFTGQSVSLTMFSQLFDLNRGDSHIYKIIGQSQLPNIICPDNSTGYNNGKWRPRYHILGEEAMKIILAGGQENKESWHLGLANRLIKLIELCGSINEQDILKSLLIDRDGTDYAGKYVEESGYKNFSRIVYDMRSNKDSLREVFQKLVDTFPDNTHFRGHFARYLYEIVPQDYGEAIKQADYAIEVSSTNDFNLHHIKGMCLKEQAQSIIRDRSTWVEIDELRKQDIESRVKELADDACSSFEESRKIKPENLHAHTAEIQLLVKVLDFGKEITNSNTKENFITNPKNVWYEEKLNFMFGLLDEAKFILEQARGTDAMRTEKSISYLNDCEASMFSILGDYMKAKERFENEINKSNNRKILPHFRRMWVYSTLALRSPESGKKRFDSWSLLKESELEQSIKYLEDNIEDEPFNGQNIRLWMNAQRASKSPILIGSAISKIATWRELNHNQFSQLESDYFLYILYAIQAIQNSDGFDKIPANRVEKILKEIHPQNQSFCFEWLGKGNDLRQMLNHKALGEGRVDESFFIRNQNKLQEVNGEIISIDRNQEGRIKLECGLTAFFVPAHGKFDSIRDTGKKVKFYLGFRQDDMQAWDVIYIEKERQKNIVSKTTDILNSESNYLELDEPSEEAVPTNELKKPLAEKLPGLTILGKIDLKDDGRKRIKP